MYSDNVKNALLPLGATQLRIDTIRHSSLVVGVILSAALFSATSFRTIYCSQIGRLKTLGVSMNQRGTDIMFAHIVCAHPILLVPFFSAVHTAVPI